MTIDATATEISYTGDGSTTVFPVPFPFDTSADLQVSITYADGSTGVISTGFSVSGGGGSTGNVTFSTAPASGIKVTILDNLAFTQPTDYTDNDAFPAETHEKALDRVTRLTKRLKQLITRTLRFPDGDIVSDAQLASVDTRKGKYLFFNAVTGTIEYAVALTTTTLSQSIIAQLLNPQHPLEAAAGVTPTNYWYQPGDIRRYGAKVDGTTDDYAAVQQAFNIGQYSGGHVWGVYIPPGPGAAVSQSITMYPNTRVYGEGANCSFLFITNANALLKSTSPINVGNAAVHLLIEKLGLTTTALSASTSGAIEITAGSYVTIRDCYIYNSRWGVILDQAEHVRIRDCVFSSAFNHGVPGGGVWLVNGADHTVGALPGFTNRITIDGCQFNFTKGASSAYACILDDGGGNHTFSNNNFDGGQYGIRAAFAASLTLFNNEHENAYLGDVWITEKTRAGTYYGPCYGFHISDCTAISPGTSGGTPAGSITIESGVDGVIAGNVLGNYTTGGVYFPNTPGYSVNLSSNITLGPNDKVVTGSGKTIPPLYAAANGSVLKSCRIIQGASTYVQGTVTAGTGVTVTPKSMEGIYVGRRLVCRNADGSNGEIVLVKATTSITFTADFTTDKAANWTLRGGPNGNTASGRASFSSATTCTVSLDTAEYDNNYSIRITPTSLPAGKYFTPTAQKQANSFRVDCDTSGSWSFDWELVRD